MANGVTRNDVGASQKLYPVRLFAFKHFNPQKISTFESGRNVRAIALKHLKPQKMRGCFVSPPQQKTLTGDGKGDYAV